MVQGFFVCRKCGSRFVTLRDARVHLRGCVGGFPDLSVDLQFVENKE